MLKSSLVISLTESLAQAIRHTADLTHRHVLQDASQNIRYPRSHTHPAFAIGTAFGRSSSRVQAHAGTFTTALVIVMLRDNLARHDHEDLNSFSQVLGCQTIDYTSRVSFVLGWLTAVIDQGMAPVHSVIPHVARCAPGAML